MTLCVSLFPGSLTGRILAFEAEGTGSRPERETKKFLMSFFNRSCISMVECFFGKEATEVRFFPGAPFWRI